MAFIFFVFFMIISSSMAAESKFAFEPIYGIENSMIRYPEPSHYVTRAHYGVRFTYGSDLLSGEGEYSEAKSRDDYPGLDQKVVDTSNRLSLGARSNLNLTKILSIFLRGGLRASKGQTVVTTAGIDNHVENPLRLDPYAGAGLQVSIANNFNLNAGATLIRNSANQFDTQYTLGLNTHFGSR